MPHALMNHLWQSTVFAIATGILALFFRKNGAHTRYWLWFAASCKFLIPFSVLSAIGAHLHVNWRATPLEPVRPMLGEFARPFSAAPVELPGRLTASATASGIDPHWIWLGVWACGAAAVGIYWMIRWMRINAAVRNGKPLSLEVAIPARSSSVSIEPGVVGFFRPVILMPEGICERLTAPQLQLILAHEMSHLRRRDNRTAAVQMLVEALFWFHPLVWWMGRRLIVEREAACDEAVIGSGGNREVYAQAVLAVCKFYLKMPLDCSAGVSGANLKKRIEFIMTSRPTLKLNAARKALLATAATATVVIPLVMGSALAIPPHLPAFSVGLNGGAFQKVVIRESQPDGGFSHDNVFPGGYSAENFSLRSLTAFAFDGQDGLVSGPKSLDDRYDIQARAPGAFTANGYEAVDQARAMVRRMLAEQFGLEIHRSARAVSAFVLTASPTGVHLQEARSDGDDGPLLMVGPTSIQCKMVRMSDFAGILSRHELGQAVLDQTGLTGTYNFKLDWNSRSGPDPRAGDNTSADSPTVRAEVLASALQSQLGLTLRLQQTTVQFLIVDRAEPPKGLLPAYKAIPMEPQSFDRYAGHYEFPGEWIMTVSREKEHFWTQLQGQPRVEIFPEGKGEFFAKVVDAQISFGSDSRGQTTGLVLHQNGRDTGAPRMDDAAAQKLIDVLNARIEKKIPVPGSEEALRRLILGTANGKPNYEQMSPNLAAAAREQLPDIQRFMTRMGPLVSLRFTGVDPWGWDIYEAQFEHGRNEWRIDLETDSKVRGAWYGPIQ